MIIRNAGIRKKDGLVDIKIVKDKIDRIERAGKIKKDAGKEINADGNLVVPTFVEPFIHLDKVFLAEVVRENISGTWSEDIDSALKDSERIIRRYHNTEEFSMCRIALGPCSPFSVTKENLEETIQFARRHEGVLSHTHIADITKTLIIA